MEHYSIDLARLSPFLREVVSELAAINDYPVSMVLSTVLSSMGGLIGARAKIYNGFNVSVYPIVWSIIVAPSSLAAKSTLYRYTKLCIFGDLQNELYDEYDAKLEKYHVELKAYQAMSKDERAREIEPEKPSVDLLVFQNDGTPEAKIKSLAANPNGGIVYYDEMKAELERSNANPAYKALKTSIYDGETYHKELVNGGTFILKHPALSEVGLITEQWLLEAVQKNDIASGFMARYLFSYHTREEFRPLQIQKVEIDHRKYAAAGKMLIEIFGIDRKEPVEFILDESAQRYYKEWFDPLMQTAYETESDEEIAMTIRLSSYVLKFALISFLFNSLYRKIDVIESNMLTIPVGYVKEAIYIFDLFREQSSRVLELFSRNRKLNFEIEDISKKLARKIKANGGRIAKSAATNGIRGLNAQKLDQMVESGLFAIYKEDRTSYVVET